MADGDSLILGSSTNSADDRTTLTKNRWFFPALALINYNGVGLLALGGDGSGINAEAIAASSPAWGVNAHGGISGVWGYSTDGTGAVGSSDSGRGVLAMSQGGVGIEATSATAPGVYANSVDSDGVYAYSVNRNGVYATSSNGNAINGFAQGSGAGVVGGSVRGYAGHFVGPVLVAGDFTVLGMKSAAVLHPDGSHRRLYSVESPESWFEDFGEGKLTRGKCRVRLDSDFVVLVSTKKSHVFLTPQGDSNGIYVSRQGRGFFDVRELRGGKSDIGFSYRVVARRRDVRGQRLARVTIPRLPPEAKIEHSKLPEPPPNPTQRLTGRARRKVGMSNAKRAIR